MIDRGFAESEGALHEEARRAAGCDAFGDPSYLEGLRVLLRAYDEEANFTTHGRAAARYTIIEALRQRLLSNQAWQRNPRILDREIRGPIVICGLVRTGSTALHYLMGCNPDLQVLQYWLAGHPQPRPARAEWEQHPDYQVAAAEIDAMYQADPSLKAIRLMMADGPEECRHLLMQQFTDDTFEVNASIPSYSRWYERVNMTPSYRRHRDLLKLIGSNDPERQWLLKYPVHMRNLEAFLEVYPDACIVQTHRDPLRVMPSYISLIAGFRALNEKNIDRPAFARRQLDLWATGAESAIEFRRSADPSQFYDLHFADFMADPIAAVRKIHAYFGGELSEAGERALRAWQNDNPQHKHGRHEYRSEEIGITRDEILERFEIYMKHYGIESEDASR